MYRPGGTVESTLVVLVTIWHIHQHSICCSFVQDIQGVQKRGIQSETVIIWHIQQHSICCSFVQDISGVMVCYRVFKKEGYNLRLWQSCTFTNNQFVAHLSRTYLVLCCATGCSKRRIKSGTVTIWHSHQHSIYSTIVLDLSDVGPAVGLITSNIETRCSWCVSVWL